MNNYITWRGWLVKASVYPFKTIPRRELDCCGSPFNLLLVSVPVLFSQLIKITFSSVKEAEWPPSRKKMFIQLTACAMCNLLFKMKVISGFLFVLRTGFVSDYINPFSVKCDLGCLDTSLR